MAQPPTEKVSQDKLARLSFRRDLCNYVYYSDTNGRSYGYLYETDEETYYKIKDILSGSITAQVKKKDRIFVLPGNTLPLKRIKAYAKSVGAYVVNEIEKATVLAGNNDLEADAYLQAKFSHVMFESQKYRCIIDNTDEFSQSMDDTFECIVVGKNHDRIKNDFAEGIPCIVSEYAASKVGFDSNIDPFDENRYFMYPVAIEALYYALAKKLPIISQGYLTEFAHSSLDLADPAVYKSLDDMFTSSDSNNTALAVQVLSHAKFDNENAMCTYHLWKLQTNHHSKVSRRERDKNISHFISQSRWHDLEYLSMSEYINYAYNNNLLIKDLFIKFLPEIKELEQRRLDESEFYHCTNSGITGFVYRLRPKWAKIINPDKIIENE